MHRHIMHINDETMHILKKVNCKMEDCPSVKINTLQTSSHKNMVL